MKEYELTKPTLLTRSIVDSKSFSLSPGYPIIKSLEIFICLLISLSFLIVDKYYSRECFLFIKLRISFDPLCTGRCSIGISFLKSL